MEHLTKHNRNIIAAFRKGVEWQKKAVLLVVLILGVAAAYGQTACQYTRAAGTVTAYCTLPDGTGVETDLSGESASDTVYSPAEWTARLAHLAQAESNYLSAVEKIRLDIHKKNWALRIHDKRTCKAQGFTWHRAVPEGWCTAPATDTD